jgi:hypothetical protein
VLPRLAQDRGQEAPTEPGTRSSLTGACALAAGLSSFSMSAAYAWERVRETGAVTGGHTAPAGLGVVAFETQTAARSTSASSRVSAGR